MPARAAGSGSPPATVTLLPENFRNCEKGQLWLNSNELEAVRQALAAQSSRLSLQWAVEPVWVSKAEFLRRKNMKMADPSDEEEEKDATNGEGSASPISALSGSMLSHGHDLSHLRKDLPLKDRRALEKRKDRKDPPDAKGGRSNKPPLKPPKRIKKPSKPSKSESDGNASDDDEDDEDQDEDEDRTPGTPGTPGTRGPMKPKPSTDFKATPQDTPSVFKEGSKEDLKATYWQKKAQHAKPEKFQKDSDKEPDDKALESKSAKGEKRPNEDKDDLLQEMAMRGKKSKTGSKDDASDEEIDAAKAQQQVEYLDGLRQRLSETQRDQLANRFGQAMDLPQMDQETRRQLAWHMEDQLGVPRNQDLFDGWNHSPPAS